MLMERCIAFVPSNVVTFRYEPSNLLGFRTSKRLIVLLAGWFPTLLPASVSVSNGLAVVMVRRGAE